MTVPANEKCLALRIAIFSSGRFHVCDLARELAKRGHHVMFYSLVPWSRARRFGLRREYCRSLLPNVLYRYILHRLLKGTRFCDSSSRKLITSLDRVAARNIDECDVFIGMSGLSNLAAATIRKKYGAQIWIERGSRHILSQQSILDGIPGAAKVSQFTVERELTDYEQADYIAVLSKHSEQSFIDHGVPSEKVVCNPLGVDLDMFPPTDVPISSTPLTILMVGTWSLQKGCDILVDAWRQLAGVRLLHVGSVGDLTLPNDSGFEHVDAVDQNRLLQFYAGAHVLALASRQDGFGMVLLQALACGLRLVCSDRTGGDDLKAYVDNPEAIQVVPHGDVAAFAGALKISLDKCQKEQGSRNRIVKEMREEISWAGYAKRYEKNLLARL